MNNRTINSILDKVLYFLVLIFPSIIILRSLTINIITALISIIVLFYIFKNRQISFYKNKIVKYIIVFFLFIFINAIIHYVNFDLILKSLSNFRYLLLTFAVFLVLEKISDQQIKFFVYFNIIVIFLVEIDIVYQFIFYKDIFGFVPGICTEIFPIKCTRFSGVFGQELIAGSYLSQIGFLILILFINLDVNKSYINFLIKFFLFIFLLITVLLTGERAPFLILMISFFFISFFAKKLIKFFFFFIFLLTMLFLLTQKIDSINQRYFKLFDNWGPTSIEASIKNKITESPWSFHYQAAIELFLDKPILGHGPRSFRIFCENTNIDKLTRDKKTFHRDYRACSTHPHNYFLEFLSENGIIGGVFFIGLIILIFVSIYKKSKNIKNASTLIGIGSLILAIIFPLKPSGSFFSTFNATMLFYIFGFFLYYLKKVK